MIWVCVTSYHGTRENQPAHDKDGTPGAYEYSAPVPTLVTLPTRCKLNRPSNGTGGDSLEPFSQLFYCLNVLKGWNTQFPTFSTNPVSIKAVRRDTRRYIKPVTGQSTQHALQSTRLFEPNLACNVLFLQIRRTLVAPLPVPKATSGSSLGIISICSLTCAK